MKKILSFSSILLLTITTVLFYGVGSVYAATSVPEDGATAVCEGTTDNATPTIYVDWSGLLTGSPPPYFSTYIVDPYVLHTPVLYASVNFSDGEANISGVWENENYTLELRGDDGTGEVVLMSWSVETPICQATINVTANIPDGSWIINPGNHSGSDLSSTHTVSPDGGGTGYSITVTPPSGYQVKSITNSQGGTDSVAVFPGGTEGFDIEFGTSKLTVDLKGNGSDSLMILPPGAIYTLTWDSLITTNDPADTYTCTASGYWSGSKPHNGSEDIVMPATSNGISFEISCLSLSGAYGSDELWVCNDTSQCNVGSGGGGGGGGGSYTGPTDIKANGSDGPITIPKGDPVNLSWVSAARNIYVGTYVTPACTASARPSNASWTGGKNSFGTQLVPVLNISTVFDINCNNGTSDSVTVNTSGGGGGPVTVTADIKADGSDTPITLASGSNTNLTWSSTNATECQAYASPDNSGWTGVQLRGNPTGVSVGPLNQSTLFSLTCTEPGGSSGSDAVQVYVNVPPAPPTGLTATTSPACGGQIVLSWNDQPDATSFQISRGNQSNIIYNGPYVASITDAGLTPGVSYTYWIRAVNAYGQSNWSSSASAIASVACPSWNYSLNGPDTLTIQQVANTISATSTYDLYKILSFGTPEWVITNVLSGLPSGVTIGWTTKSCIPTASPGCRSRLFLNAPYTVTPGIYNVTLTNLPTSGSPVHNKTFQLIINPPGGTPDLTAGGVTPTSATVGTAVTLTASISNIGTAGTGASFSNFFQVCSVPGGCAVPTDLSATTMSALANGASANTTRLYTFPSATTYSARACADKTSSAGGGVIAESNEGNNCGAWTDVTVSPAGGAFDYHLSNDGSVNVVKGGAVDTSNVTKTLDGGTPQSVNITASGQPSGVSITYNNSNRTCSPTPTCTSQVNFSADMTVSAGTYPITITGDVLSNKTTSFNLIVSNPPASSLSVSCQVSLSPYKVGQPVTWTANIVGGTPPYTYAWSGTDFPSSPAPSGSSYTHTYQTTGTKTASVTVNDDASQSASCPVITIQVAVDPKFKEF